jgi:hypothetical protein
MLVVTLKDVCMHVIEVRFARVSLLWFQNPNNLRIRIIAAERSEAAHYSWHVVVSPESTRPSLSLDLCIVEISILCLSVNVEIRGE